MEEVVQLALLQLAVGVGFLDLDLDRGVDRIVRPESVKQENDLLFLFMRCSCTIDLVIV